MSLFDVIKYPVSDPPTVEELTNLPIELLLKWLDLSGFSVDYNNNVFDEDRKEYLARWVIKMYVDRNIHVNVNLTVLRQMIKDLP